MAIGRGFGERQAPHCRRRITRSKNSPTELFGTVRAVLEAGRSAPYGGELVLVYIHADPQTGESHTLELEQETLVEPGFSRQDDSAPSSDDPLPRQTVFLRVAQRTSHYSRAARVAGCSGNLPVAGHPAARNPANDLSDFFEETHAGDPGHWRRHTRRLPPRQQGCTVR